MGYMTREDLYYYYAFPRRLHDLPDAMKTKLANHNVETLPLLTDVQREHLAELAALPDESIDTSDIPELSEEAWAAGARGRFYRPIKQRREMLASLKRVRRA